MSVTGPRGKIRHAQADAFLTRPVFEHHVLSNQWSGRRAGSLARGIGRQLLGSLLGVRLGAVVVGHRPLVRWGTDTVLLTGGVLAISRSRPMVGHWIGITAFFGLNELHHHE